MVIESRTIVGAAAALMLVGAVLWGSALLLQPPADNEKTASVEVTQVAERSWAVEIKDLSTNDTSREDKMAAAAR